MIIEYEINKAGVVLLNRREESEGGGVLSFFALAVKNRMLGSKHKH